MKIGTIVVYTGCYSYLGKNSRGVLLEEINIGFDGSDDRYFRVYWFSLGESDIHQEIYLQELNQHNA